MVIEKKIRLLKEIEERFFKRLDESLQENPNIPMTEDLDFLSKIHALIRTYEYQLEKEELKAKIPADDLPF